MTPVQRIWDMIQSPLQHCRPAEIPKKRRLYTPAGLDRLVWKGREKTRRWLAEQRV